MSTNSLWAPSNLKYRKLLFAGGFFLVAGILLVVMRVTQPTIKSRNDLAFVSGQLNGYNFHDGTRGTHIYTFKIVGYESHFKIGADFLGFFDKAGFESIDPKEDLTVGIFKKDLRKLSIPGKTVFVYAIADKDVNYLDVDQAIKAHNSLFAYYASAVFIVMGIITIYFNLPSKVKARLSALRVNSSI
jgi:hypothetical protein